MFVNITDFTQRASQQLYDFTAYFFMYFRTPTWDSLFLRAISMLSNDFLEILSLQIYGSGKQTRSFQYVTDLVEGLIKLMNSNYSNPINLGNPEEYTIEQLATVIKEAVGENSLLHPPPPLDKLISILIFISGVYWREGIRVPI